MPVPISLIFLLLARAVAASPEEGGLSWTPESRLFTAERPSAQWRALEEDGAVGAVARLFGPEDSSGLMRATLSVRLVDRDSPSFLPIKPGVSALRAPDAATSRRASPMRTLRVAAGLARTFEIVETRRLPFDEGPSTPLELHHYVAVIPHVGESYFVVRLVTSRNSYLDFRDDFVRFLKSLRPLG